MKTDAQFTAVAIERRAILIEGAPGSGKSSLALALIDRGAELIGDDSVRLEARGGSLFASPHPETRGLIEVRNIGLVNMAPCEEAPVCLVIRLDLQAPRFIDTPASTRIEGIELPCIALWPGSPIQAIKTEHALAKFGAAPK